MVRVVIALALMAGGAFSQSVPLFADLFLNYRGELSLDYWYYPEDSDVNKTASNQVSTLNGKTELIIHSSLPVELRFTPRIILDLQDDSRSRKLQIEDLYIDYFTNYFEIRAGYQIFSWKAVESFSPADFLNQTDREIDFLDPPKIGELAIRTRLVMPTELEQVLEGYYFAKFRPTEFPTNTSRQFFANVSNGYDDHKYNSSKKEWRPQGALRYKTSLFNIIDFNLFYFNGYDRFPGILPSGLNSPGIQEYRPMHKAGLTFQGVLESWLVKGEAVYNHYETDISVVGPFGQISRFTVDPYVAYTLGFEYTLYGLLFQNHDLGTILEILGDTDSGKEFSETGTVRFFQNHIFAGLRYTFNNVSDRNILAGGFFDYRVGDVLMNFRYEERLFKHFKLRLEYAGVFAKLIPGFDSDASSLFNFKGDGVLFAPDFENMDRLDIEAIFTF